jgi:hypothetical protein
MIAKVKAARDSIDRRKQRSLAAPKPVVTPLAGETE